uniref:Bm13129, isoform a n=1 Tax=Brugia malayi TaxID=6279 RepID=A0A1I9G0S2_BRUMA|nr:Bm13129, isoform a [Brugia malayi]
MQADSPIHGDSAKYPRLRIEIYPCILLMLCYWQATFTLNMILVLSTVDNKCHT